MLKFKNKELVTIAVIKLVHGADTISSGIEGAWTSNPIKWDMGYFDNLFGHEWELTKSPAGAYQWKPKKNGTSHCNDSRRTYQRQKKHAYDANY